LIGEKNISVVLFHVNWITWLFIGIRNPVFQQDGFTDLAFTKFSRGYGLKTDTETDQVVFRGIGLFSIGFFVWRLVLLALTILYTQAETQALEKRKKSFRFRLAEQSAER
jgi:hypothetical protein